MIANSRYCTHPNQTWCDCDACRDLREASKEYDRLREKAARIVASVHGVINSGLADAIEKAERRILLHGD